jgi:hypothetical protein
MPAGGRLTTTPTFGTAAPDLRHAAGRVAPCLRIIVRCLPAEVKHADVTSLPAGRPGRRLGHSRKTRRQHWNTDGDRHADSTGVPASGLHRASHDLRELVSSFRS